MKKRVLAGVMSLGLLMGCAAYAANESYHFGITAAAGNTTMYIYSPTSNQKFYNQQDGTIRCTSQNAPGYGYYIGLTNSKNNVLSTRPQWLKTGRKRYTPYKNNMGIVGDYFKAAGRFDNDYSGTYTCDGTFNADKT